MEWMQQARGEAAGNHAADRAGTKKETMDVAIAMAVLELKRGTMRGSTREAVGRGVI